MVKLLTGNYTKHLLANWKVAGKCLVMFIFHFIHGIVPAKFTEHEFWGVGKEQDNTHKNTVLHA
jgi:hypothetical protein